MRLMSVLASALSLALHSVCACKRDTEARGRGGSLPVLPAWKVGDGPLGLSEAPTRAERRSIREEIELGRLLFFEPRLSADASMACVACHSPDHGWADGNARSLSGLGSMNRRNSPPVTNLAYLDRYMWDGRDDNLETVCENAWRRQLDADLERSAERLNATPDYSARFQRTVGAPATPGSVAIMLAAFLRSLKSGGSAFDRYQAGEERALADDAKRGWKVFQDARCITCHPPPLFTDHAYHDVGVRPPSDGPSDRGREEATSLESDRGKFRTPSLRDVTLTAPYFHDGSTATLDEAIARHASIGGSMGIAARERADLRAFLESLVGRESGLYVRNPD